MPIEQSICPTCQSNIRVDLSAPNAGSLLIKNLQCHSYVVLEQHDLPVQLMEDIFAKWNVFFSSEEKHQWLRSNFYDEGYVPFHTEIAQGSNSPDYKEFYETHSYGKLPFSISTDSTAVFLNKCITLSGRVTRLIDMNLPCEVKATMYESLSTMIDGNRNHMVRVIHYPPIKRKEKIERSAPHGDACLFTILPVVKQRGLKFLHPCGDWHEPLVNCSDVILFNSDMLQLCTNGYFRSALHRVMNIGDTAVARYSLPFFIHPNRNSRLTSNLTAFEFMQRRLTEIGYDGYKLINTDAKTLE